MENIERELAAIEARAESAEKWEFKNIADIDRATLLALVREQAAKLDRVNELVRYLDCLAPGDKHYAGLIRAAITATEEGK